MVSSLHTIVEAVANVYRFSEGGSGLPDLVRALCSRVLRSGWRVPASRIADPHNI